jgi:hypothetical protein
MRLRGRAGRRGTFFIRRLGDGLLDRVLGLCV